MNVTNKIDIFRINTDESIYEIFKSHTLGTGSYSNVYLGRCLNSIKINKIDLKEDKYVAIKKINKTRLSSQGIKMLSIEKTINENIMNWKHKNIVRCYDIIDDIDVIYIIMEYCENKDFSHLLIKRPVKHLYIKYYIKQIIDALKFLHEKNIIHRDIKPKNILLTNNYKEIKLCDFGFAKQPDGLKKVLTVCGSPLYMAPEIYKKQGYNNSVDIWSLGIILYELIFGIHPLASLYDVKNITDFLTNNDINIPNTDRVSFNCLDLLRNMLNKDENNRITIDELFIHPWYLEECNLSEHDKNELFKILEEDDLDLLYDDIKLQNNKISKHNDKYDNLFNMD